MTTELDIQLDDLFGPETPAPRADESRGLARIAGAIDGLEVTTLWLAAPTGELLAAWAPSAEPSATDEFHKLQEKGLFRNRHDDRFRTFSDEDGVVFLVEHFDGTESAGILAGRLRPAPPEVADECVAQLQRLHPWLAACAALALTDPRQNKSTNILTARLEQLSNERVAFREEHQQMVAAMLEERDARIREQQEYLTRLEDEVATRTRKLRKKSKRLKRAVARHRRDLESAALIQQSLLPASLPKLAGVDVAWTFRPCDELAGDSLNVFRLDEGHLGLYVLDVSGHGVPAALLSVTLSRLLSPTLDQSTLLKRRLDRAPYYALTPPNEVAAELNRQFQMQPETSQYFTMLYGILDVKNRQLRYVSAGHPGLVHLRAAGGSEVREAPGFAIGWFEEAEYQETTLSLEAGDRIVLYSDGLTEASDETGKAFGNQGLLETLEACRTESLETTVARLPATIEQWCLPGRLMDDLSVLALQID